MKETEDICIVVMARRDSSRLPNKMVLPLTDTGITLIDLICEKLADMEFPTNQVYFAVKDEEIESIVDMYTGLDGGKFNILHRSDASLSEEGDIRVLFEWYKELGEKYRYVILINACLPFLKPETIQEFINDFKSVPSQGMFSVITKKTFYWDSNGLPMTEWPEGFTTMNTKYVKPTYEAGHALYASRLDIIEHGYFMDRNIPAKPALFAIDDGIEMLDIDHQWQFDIAKCILSNELSNGGRGY